MSKIQKLLKCAIREANKSTANYAYRMGAAAFRNGKVFAAAHNQNKTDPGTENRTRKLHAEFCLACHNLEDATVLVVRLNKRGELRLARPCATCTQELVGTRKVLYTDSNYNIRDFSNDSVVAKINATYEVSDAL